MPDLIMCALPGFAACILAEYTMEGPWIPDVAARYDGVDTFQSLLHGLADFAVTKMVVPATLFKYFAREQPLLGESWMGLMVVWLGVDWTYYWMHRLSHQIGWLWMGHSVHHSSRRYNFSTALRQSWWQGLYGGVFYLPWAMVTTGDIFIRVLQVITIYQFWLHTCHFDKGFEWFEWVFNTPSHHRVHHDARGHKNFGGMLILWDRLYGTFLAEGERPSTQFGLFKPPPPSDDVVLQMASTNMEWFRLKGPAWETATLQRTFPPPPNPVLLTSGDDGYMLAATFMIGFVIVCFAPIARVWALVIMHIGGMMSRKMLVRKMLMRKMSAE